MIRFIPLLFLFLPWLLPVSPAGTANAQTTIPVADSSRIWVDGASNRSEWTVYAPVWNAELTGGEGVPAGVRVTIDVAAMESRKSTIMDRLMHRTFNAETHPEITFTSSSIIPLTPDSVMVSGDLSMAGETQRVDVRVHADSSASTYVVWSGEKVLKMTDYGMQPPAAMLGAMRTADDVTVRFRLFTDR
jgi:polyisoprenoid-binding protein YceI